MTEHDIIGQFVPTYHACELALLRPTPINLIKIYPIAYQNIIITCKR